MLTIVNLSLSLSHLQMRLEEFAHFLHIIATALHLLVEVRVEPVNVIESCHEEVQLQLNVIGQFVHIELLVVHEHAQEVVLGIQQLLYVLSVFPGTSSLQVPQKI